MVRAVLAWTVCYIFTLGFSHNLLRRKWYISTTLLLYKLSFKVLKRELKVAPDTELGNCYEKDVDYHHFDVLLLFSLFSR